MTWIAGCMCGWSHETTDRAEAEQAAAAHEAESAGRHKPTVRERIDE